MGKLLLDAVGAKVQSFVQERGKLQGALRDERAFVPVSGAKEGADFPQVDDGRVVGGLHGRQGAPKVGCRIPHCNGLDWTARNKKDRKALISLGFPVFFVRPETLEWWRWALPMVFHK